MARPREWTEQRCEALAKELEAWFLEPGHENERLYYKQFYSIRPDLYPELISRLQSVSEVFRQTIKRLDLVQEERLVRLALTNKINPVMAIFTLKNKHNWADKVESKTETTIRRAEDQKALEGKSPAELREIVRQLTDGKN